MPVPTYRPDSVAGRACLAAIRKQAAVDPDMAARAFQPLASENMVLPALWAGYRTFRGVQEGLTRPTTETALQRVYRWLAGGHAPQGRLAHVRDAVGEQFTKHAPNDLPWVLLGAPTVGAAYRDVARPWASAAYRGFTGQASPAQEAAAHQARMDKFAPTSAELEQLRRRQFQQGLQGNR